MIHTQTVDISKKVARYIKFTLVTALVAAAALGFAAFHFQHVEDIMVVPNAKVAGTLVSVRVLTDGKVRELTHADGDSVKAGDVLANLEVSITDEQLAQLEQAVDNARANYAELEQGQMVKVEVRTPVPKTVYIPQPTQQIVTPAPYVDLASLAERVERMNKLYEIGAISRVQRDAAVTEYEMAKIEASTPIVEEYTPDPIAETEVEYVVEYVDQFQPTPPEILEGAQLAIRQAEMSLNTARQEAQQTQVTAPVSGTIYYDTTVDRSLVAGEPIAKVGDSDDLWLEAEVTEDQFYRIALGKLVTYSIDGQNFNGTVIEKIAPLEYSVGGPFPTLLAQLDATDPIETSEQPSDQQSDQSARRDQLDQPSEQSAQSEQSEPPKTLDYTQAVDAPFDSSALEERSMYESEPERKFVVKFSLPTEHEFEYRPGLSTSVTVHDPLISWNWIKPLYRELLARVERLSWQH